MFKKLIGTSDDFGVTVVRVALGAVMFPHGAQKVLGWFGGYGFGPTLDAFVTQMGIPVPLALLAFAAEFLGGLGLIVGLLGRVAAFGVLSVMAVAASMHVQNGFFMDWTGAQGGEGYEFHLLAGAMALGASPVQVVFHHVLPLALPGILTGTIIGMARALGETAPLLMIGMRAFVATPPDGFTDPATVLPVQIFLWSDEIDRGFVERTSAAIIVLLVFLLVMNGLAIYLRNRFEKKW